MFRGRSEDGGVGSLDLHRLGGIIALLLVILTLASLTGLSQTWPRCISGCTANDVELLEVTAEVLGSCSPGGNVDAVLWASLQFNRNKSYCVRFVTDVYIDGELAAQDLVSKPFNVPSKGIYSDIYLGTISLPCGSTLVLENIKVMWSVDNKLDPVSNCQSGVCSDYGPGSKCTGDQFTSYAVTLPLDASNDTDTTDEETPVTTAILANDLLGLTPTSIISLTDGEHGSTTLNGDGTITYVPRADFDGIDAYVYTIQDSAGGLDTATVTIDVLPTNDAPIANDDVATTDENNPTNIDVTANDADPDGAIDPTTVTIISGPGAGSIDVDPATGVVAYTPDPDTCGTDEFTYMVHDFDDAVSNEATVAVTVICNDPPIAADDEAYTDENTSIGINVIANDSDSDGTIDPSSVTITLSPAEGQLSVHPATGVVTYTPDPGSCGLDSFRYTVDDDDGAISDQATVTVDVMCDDPPLAIDDLYSVAEGETLAVGTPGILANDVTSPWEPLSAVLVSDVSHGTLSLNPDGSFSYIHDGSETTSDSFSYYAFDGTENSNIAIVSIVVAPMNDEPAAYDDSGTTAEDTTITIDVLANDTDPEGDSLSVDWVGAPSNGTVVNNGANVVYTPDPDFHGTDTFTYTISDGNGGADTATVTVTVSPVNDPPTAQDDSGATDEDTSVTVDVLANDADPDSDDLVVQSVTQPADGSVVSNGADVVYTPDPGFNGTDTFTYTVSDGNGGTDTATVTVFVALVNDPPNAADDASTTLEDTPSTIAVLLNDRDPDGDALTVQSVTRPSHGTAVPTGKSVIYTPSPNYAGPDGFTYTIIDGNGGTATATVSIVVLPTNDPPTAQDDIQTTLEDTPITVAALENDSDPDGDDLRIQSVGRPAHGTVSSSGSFVAYTPDPGFNGVDSFTYTVSDGQGATDTAQVTIVVNPVNNPPIAQDDSTSTDEETLVSILILENDSDPDGDFLLVETFTQPENGTVLNTRTGVSYIPDAGFQGVDAFTYTISDGNGGTDAATVTVSVAGVNDLPIAQDDTSNTDEGVALTILVLLNDSDPDGDGLTVGSVGVPENGAVQNLGNEIEYTPDPDFNGVDSFTYTVSDGQGGTDTATVFIAVAGVNDPPVAQDDSGATNQGEPISIPVLANDEDPDRDPFFISSVSDPAGGSVRIDGGMLTYTPDPGYTGSDTFMYTISDGRGGTDSATVTVGVLAGGRGGATDAASCEGKVIISEIAWAGTSTDPRDEWIELRNLGTTPVALSGWILRWRPTHATTSEDQDWRTIELSGTLEGAATAVCDELVATTPPTVRFERESPEGVAWVIAGEPSLQKDGYFTLERRRDDTIADAKADLVYDTTSALLLELSDGGDIVMLIDASGEVVDTANAPNLGRTGWVAGNASTFGTMERIDPLGPDVLGNWHTNLGIVTGGRDKSGRPLRATPGGHNSPDLENLELYTEVVPTTVQKGEVPQVSFDLSRQDRRNTGWPWISVTRPGFTCQGGSTDLSRYSFAGRHESGGKYVLDIGTANLAPGAYTFLIIYGEGEAILVPIAVTP